MDDLKNDLKEFTPVMKAVVSQIIGSEHYEVLRYVKKPLGSKADNVAGELDTHQVKLREKNKDAEKTLHFVLKMSVEVESVAKLFLEICRIFPREIQYYREIQHDLTLFQIERGLPESQILHLAPDLFAASESPYLFIALEDLTRIGYKMADKFKMLNFEHVSMTLENLAKFHATGFAMCKIKGLSGHTMYPELKEALVIPENSGFPGSPVIKCFDEIIGLFEKLPELSSIAQKMKKYQGKTWNMLVDMFKDTTLPFVSIIHGDLWTNNILFKYDETDVEESHPVGIKFVDFQLTRYCSVALDLLYFLYTSTTSELRIRNMDKFLTIYFNSFVEMLNLLSYPVPPEITLESLKSQMKNSMAFSLFYMPFAIPMQQVTLEELKMYEQYVNENGPFHLKDDPFVDELLWRAQRGICKQRLVDVLTEMVNADII